MGCQQLSRKIDQLKSCGSSSLHETGTSLIVPLFVLQILDPNVVDSPSITRKASDGARRLCPCGRDSHRAVTHFTDMICPIALDGRILPPEEQFPPRGRPFR